MGSLERVLVTGADGFLGSNLVRRLLEEGYSVLAFTELERSTGTLDGLPVEAIRGDVLKVEDLIRAAEGCRCLVHAAASTAVWPTRSAFQDRLNILGTANAIEAALKTGLRRFIHVGTANSFEPGIKESPGVEGAISGNTRYGLGYIESKREAHRQVLEAVRSRGLPGLVVAPCFMLGPYDSKPGSGRLILAAARGRIRGVPPGGRNYVHVRDVATGIVSALRLGKVGESYIAGHENLSYAELFELIAEVLGLPPPRLRVPRALILLLGLAGSAAGRLSGSAPALTYAMARICCDDHYFSPAKAVRELAMPQTPVRTAIEDAVRWFAANGLLPPPLRARL
jgi:dihydroflavonol-4-reductase